MERKYWGWTTVSFALLIYPILLFLISDSGVVTLSILSIFSTIGLLCLFGFPLIGGILSIVIFLRTKKYPSVHDAARIAMLLFVVEIIIYIYAIQAFIQSWSRPWLFG
jgi:hypothetical protein